MPHFVSRSFRKIRPSCASALLLIAASGASQAIAQDVTITETLNNIAGTTQSLNIPNFSAQSETLIDVTFTLMLGTKSVTIYDAQDPSQDLLNVNLSTNNGRSFFQAHNINDWSVPAGNLDVTYTENTSNSSNYGATAQFLFGTKGNLACRYIDVNFSTTSTGSSNGGGTSLGGGGSPSTTPEPSVKYLSFLAAGAMALLLFGRNLRQRISTRRD
jgi:hypothetical protein